MGREPTVREKQGEKLQSHAPKEGNRVMWVLVDSQRAWQWKDVARKVDNWGRYFEVHNDF